MGGRICPVCRKEAIDQVCDNCGTDLEAFSQLTATVRELLSRAMEAMQSKSYLRALQLLKNGLEINGQDSALWLMAGLCHYALGDINQAKNCWENSENSLALEYRQKAAAEQEGFERVTAGYNQALSLMEGGNYREAVRCLRSALKGGPQYLPALELLALAYYQCKQYQRCWKVIHRIQAVTVDAPVLIKLTPDLLNKVSKLWLAYGAGLLLIAVSVLVYVNWHSSTGRTSLSVPAVKEAEVLPTVDRELLQATALSLGRQGNYLAGADILLALNWQRLRDEGFTVEEEAILSKAAARYYFQGMRYFRRRQYSEAAVAFSMSLRYPVRSYVYDDTLYYQAIVRERLGVYDQAVVLYRRLLEETPGSDYCQAAIIRWGWLAGSKEELRAEYSAAIREYPEYQDLMQSRIKAWKELVNGPL
ncbi:MAG TPA: tetratricopeptide repeat protein [Bacillota bacterium]